MNVKELRIGNLVLDPYGNQREVTGVRGEYVWLTSEAPDRHGERDRAYEASELSPIELTPEWLERAGFGQLPHFTVQNNWSKNIGRDRVISVACVGTPNEIVFINEEVPPEVKNVIVARNYDYDGKTYLHHLKNLVLDLTGSELEIAGKGI